MLYFVFLIFIVSVSSQSVSKCPGYGKMNYSCISNDYCSKSINLICGDGFCGYACPIGWVLFNNTCYFSNTNIKRNYTDAVNYCKNLNSTMLTAKTRTEIMAINTAVFKGQNFDFWISAYTSEVFPFEWSDGTELQTNDSVWDLASGEPNGYKEDKVNDENCAFMKQNGVHDVWCTEITNFICELKKVCEKSKCSCGKNAYFDDVTGTCVPFNEMYDCCSEDKECNYNQGLYCINGQCDCNDDFKWDVIRNRCLRCLGASKSYGDKCYVISTRARNYVDSIAFCQQNNAKLIEITLNDTRFIQLQQYYSFSANGIWINATEFMRKYPSNSIYCGGVGLTISSTECIFADLYNAKPYCIFKAPCSSNYGLICEQV